MKKVYLLVAALVIVTCVFIFTGCDTFYEHEHEHEHVHVHEPGAWLVDKVATCKDDGFKHQICSNCKESIKTEVLPASDKGHVKGAWIVDREATCIEDGSKHQVCSVCEESIKTVVIYATGHTDGEWIVDKEAACTEDGSKHRVCSICEESITTVVIPATGHNDGEWIVDKEATCTEDGSQHQVCSVCEESIKTEIIPVLEHQYSFSGYENNGIVGSDIYFKCTVCDEQKTEKIEDIEATIITERWADEMLSHTSYREFSVKSSGGCGKLQYKFELTYNSYNGASGRPELVSDFSDSNYCSYQVQALYYSAVLTVTIRDEAGNEKVFEISDSGSAGGWW